MSTRFHILLAGVVLAVTVAPLAQADAVTELLQEYRQQGADNFAAAAGARRWQEEFTDAESGKTISCASCHHQDLRQTGQHIRTRKPIEPLAPSVNKQRLTDPAKIEKWLLRNCKGTWGRECTPQEKGDFLVYIQSQ